MMKKLFGIVAIAALAFVGLSTNASAEGVVTGEAAPNYSFTDVNGVNHNLADFKGKTVVIEWNNMECPFVKKFYKNGDMQRFQKETLGNYENAVWIAVNSSAEGKQGAYDSIEEAKADIAAKDFSGTAYVLDPTGEFGKLFNAKTTPHMFVIDAEGTIAYQGAIDSERSADPDDITSSENYVIAAVDALSKGQAIATTETQPYGCSVKY